MTAQTNASTAALIVVANAMLNLDEVITKNCNVLRKHIKVLENTMKSICIMKTKQKCERHSRENGNPIINETNT